MNQVTLPFLYLLIFSGSIGLNAQRETIIQFSDRSLPSINSVKKYKDKCEIVTEWLLRYIEEFPQPITNRRNYNRNIYYKTHGHLLFRDEDFIQLFDKPFDRFSEKEVEKIYKKVVGPCVGLEPPNTLSNKIHQLKLKTNKFKSIGDRERLKATIKPADERLISLQHLIKEGFGSKRPEYINHLIKSRKARHWMDETLQSLQTGSNIGIDLLVNIETDKRITLLWPSEQKHFRGELEKAKHQLSRKMIESWILTLEKYQNNLSGAQQLQKDFTSLKAKLALSEQLGDIEQQVNLKLNYALSNTMAVEEEMLEKMPFSIAGYERQRLWLQAFRDKYDRFNFLPVVSNLEQKAVHRLANILERSKSDWISTIQNSPYDNPTLLAQGKQLSNLFPTYNSQLSNDFNDYLNPLLEKAVRVYSTMLENKWGSDPSPNSPYVMPTLIEAIIKGNFDKIPDDRLTRQYVASVMKGLTECKEWNILAPHIVEYGLDLSMRKPVNVLERLFNTLEKSTKGDFVGAKEALGPGFLYEGVEDSRTLIENLGCNSTEMSTVRNNLGHIVVERYRTQAEPNNTERFSSLMNPVYREKEGIKSSSKINFNRTELLIESCLNSYGRNSNIFCRCLVGGVTSTDIPQNIQNSLLVYFNISMIKQLMRNYTRFADRSANCWK